MLAFTVFVFFTLVLVNAALSIIVSKPSWGSSQVFRKYQATVKDLRHRR